MASGSFHVGRADGVSDHGLHGRLGSRLRQFRKERGMTILVLASSAQCSQAFLIDVENGSLAPSLPMLQRLSRALQISLGSLLEEAALDHH